MLTKFNDGKAFSCSDAIKGGKLQGATDTDYFYFFCPTCSDKQLMRILDYDVQVEHAETPYPDLRPKAAKGFVLAFKLHCPKCGLTDFTKIGNLRWQKGTHDEALKISGFSRTTTQEST